MLVCKPWRHMYIVISVTKVCVYVYMTYIQRTTRACRARRVASTRASTPETSTSVTVAPVTSSWLMTVTVKVAVARSCRGAVCCVDCVFFPLIDSLLFCGLFCGCFTLLSHFCSPHKHNDMIIRRQNYVKTCSHFRTKFRLACVTN